MIIYKKPKNVTVFPPAKLRPGREAKAETTVETAMVFTKRGRNGNGLGVVTDARGLDAKKMQKIAKELGFSETSFVFPADTPGSDYAVRFFTPKKEIPFAGHPSIGTLFVLLEKRLLRKKEGYVQQIGGRKVPLRLMADGRISMDQGRPVFGEKIKRAVLARLLRLDESVVAGDGMVVSTGLPHILAPLSSKNALRNARLSTSIYEKVRKAFKADCVMPFFAEGGAVFCRNFVPAFGMAEDPATGSGCGPLACYIVRNGKSAAKKDGIFELEVSQGVGTVSQLFAWVRAKGGGISGVEVGGYCAMGKKRVVLS
jgi:trans-2,3-dihydro-3-hydroxyanthranilate isomerase